MGREFLVFTGSMFDGWLKTGLVNPKRPIWRADPVAASHRRLNGVIPAKHPIGELAALAATGRLQAVIADLAAQQAFSSNAPSAAPSWLDAARIRLKTGDSPEAVARSLKLGHDTFRKRFAAATGLAPAQFQMLRRIEHACTLLRDDSLPHKTIAERTGSPTSFTSRNASARSSASHRGSSATTGAEATDNHQFPQNFPSRNRDITPRPPTAALWRGDPLAYNPSIRTALPDMILLNTTGDIFPASFSSVRNRC